MTVHLSAADFDTEADLIAYAQANPTAWMGCVCNGADNGCDYCDDEGVYPAWIHDPEITGYPHERPDGR